MFVFGRLPDDVSELLGVLDSRQASSQAGLFAVARAGNSVLEVLGRLTAAHGLTPAQFRLLMVLRFMFPGGGSMSDVADVLEIRPPSLTELVNGAPELFARVPSPSDRRVALLSATAEGARRLDETLPDVAALATRLREDLGDRDWLKLVTLAVRLHDTLTNDGQ